MPPSSKIKLTDTQQVENYIAALPVDIQSAVQSLRAGIMAAHPLIAEHIKWNAPAFYYTGPMAPFNPKEYKRDIAVMNLHRGRLMLVLPTGARLQHTLLEGSFIDGRRIITFTNLHDVTDKLTDLQLIVNQWINTIEV